MESPRAQSHPDSEIDLNALAWVQDELRRSLESAHKQLRRHLKDSETVFDADVDDVDPAVLRAARQQIHQGVGALELVGLSAAARMLRASEAVVQQFVAKPKRLDVEAVDTIERASFALLDYVGRLLEGKTVSALSLFPQYRAIQELAGAERVHPSELWNSDWRWLELPADPTARPLTPDARTERQLEQQLLALMRAPGGARRRAALERLSHVCAGLGAGAERVQVATLWKLAAAVFEAQARGLLEPDVFSKRVASRLLPQFRILGSGQDEVSERLAHDLLFFCAQADSPGAGHSAPRLAAVRQAYQLAAYRSADYSKSVLGRFDPVLITQARKRVASAKDAWGAVAGGDGQRLAGLSEQFSLVGDSLRRLYPGGEVLADELQATSAQAQQAAAVPAPPLAMEVATSLLYLDASLADAYFDEPQQRERVQRLAERIAAVRGGQPPLALEDWMEELYRRVSDRQTLGSVVHELRASLAESEALIDRYFRQPTDPQVLVPVPAQLSAMRGVLSVLGLEQASQAALRMRDDVADLVETEVDPVRAAETGTFDRLASNLGALGFLIDMYSVQPQMAKSLFAFDAQSGMLNSLMGRPQPHVTVGARAPAAVPARLIEQAQTLAFSSAREEIPVAELARDLDRLSHEAQAAGQPDLVAAVSSAKAALAAAPDDAAALAARGQLSDSLVEFVHTASDPASLEAEAAPPAAAAVSGATDHAAAVDDEMREVFLEEAREVLLGAHGALALLQDEPADPERLTTIRRAFHTLKGSSWMVGLHEFGDAAWACEQLYNTRLAQQRPADLALLEFTTGALADLGQWLDAIAGGHAPDRHQIAWMQSAAEALASSAPAQAEPTAGAVELPGENAVRPAFPPGMPGPADLEFEAAAVGAPEPAAVPQELGFELDLGALDEHAAAPTASDSEVPAPADEPVLDDEQFKQVGELRIPIPLFNIYLNEADELSRRLGTELAEWAMELHRPVGDDAVALAHSLAGCSATVGFADLSQLSRALEHALARSNNRGHGDAEEAQLYVDAAEDIRRLLHQFAAGFLKEAPAGLLARFAEREAADASTPQAQPLAVPAVPAQAGPAAQAEPIVAEMVDEAAASGWAEQAQFETEHGTFGLPEFRALTDLPESLPGAAPSNVEVDADDEDDEIDAVDAVDAELFPLFAEEGQELLLRLSAGLRDWAQRADDTTPAAGAMRSLHTLKGGARLAGAMRLGEMCHRLEARVERLLARPLVEAAEVEALQGRADALMAAFEALCAHDGSAGETAPAVPSAAAARPAAPPAIEDALAEPDRTVEVVPAPALPARAGATPQADAARAEVGPASAEELPEVDWSAFGEVLPPQVADRATGPVAPSAVRVRAALLDRMVNQAGEVSIARTRIDADVVAIKSALADLTENLDRLRQQLREIELQGETQRSSRLEAAKAAAEAFDPLEFDRYTRFQELTRMMVESVGDVATVQRALQRAVQGAEDELAAQARLTRALQDDLLRTRMVEFESQADRLYRVVRQAAKETGKQVRLDIVGGAIEVDRGVLDRMTASFEHLLRNCVTHGIEKPQERAAAGKDAVGAIVVALEHDGNEVAIEFRDDGAGLDLQRIHDRGVALGLIDAGRPCSEAELANLIFNAGFSTADNVTELAGRGVGMDVVRSEVNAMGGRIETATAAGKGTSFKLVLPLTTAVTQVVMLRCGTVSVAVPSTLVEVVQRVTPEEIDRAGARGSFPFGERNLPFFWLGALLQQGGHSTEGGRTRSVVVIRSARQRIALHVDEVLGNQEAVVKNLGPQLARLPGLAGMTLLASGQVALIYNPVALATLYGDSAHALMRAAPEAPEGQPPAAGPAADLAPLVMVVDDSLTVRRVAQRLLQREGYRVVVAKDGLDALERLAQEKPRVVLSDIEMPRMDGFDLVRNIRGDARLRDLPVIMITSRIAQKHRDVAAELGVDHYLGKPYAEEELLALVRRYTAATVEA